MKKLWKRLQNKIKKMQEELELKEASKKLKEYILELLKAEDKEMQVLGCQLALSDELTDKDKNEILDSLLFTYLNQKIDFSENLELFKKVIALYKGLNDKKSRERVIKF